jgi:CheY-like chemotaxis protein
MVLEPQKDIDVVAEAADGQQAVTQARTQRPDVILMDVRMPGIDGVKATRTVIDEGLTPDLGGNGTQRRAQILCQRLERPVRVQVAGVVAVA